MKAAKTRQSLRQSSRRRRLSANATPGSLGGTRLAANTSSPLRVGKAWLELGASSVIDCWSLVVPHACQASTETPEPQRRDRHGQEQEAQGIHLRVMAVVKQVEDAQRKRFPPRRINEDERFDIPKTKQVSQ